MPNSFLGVEPPTGHRIRDLAAKMLQNVRREKCGTVRWAVKTLSDVDSMAVTLKPQVSTVHGLVNAEMPEKKGPKRIRGLEFFNFKVRGIFVGYKLSSDDNDFHVVIKDLRTRDTMIVEFADPKCQGLCSSPFVQETSKFKILNERVEVEIWGIPFWDHIHGQIGARNGIELHPVIWYRELPSP